MWDTRMTETYHDSCLFSKLINLLLSHVLRLELLDSNISAFILSTEYLSKRPSSNSSYQLQA